MPKKKKRLDQSVTINVSLTGHPRSLKQALLDLFGAGQHPPAATREAPMISSDDAQVDEPRQPGTLTPTERQITELLAARKSNKEIATALTIEHNTVKSHIHNIYKKIDVHSRGQFLEWWSKQARDE